MVKDNNCAWAVTRPGESVPFVVCDTKGCALSIAAKCAVVSDCIQGDTPEKVDPAMIDDVVDVLVEVIKNA